MKKEQNSINARTKSLSQVTDISPTLKSTELLENLSGQQLEQWLKPTLRFLHQLKKTEHKNEAEAVIEVIKTSLRETTYLPIKFKIVEIYRRISNLFIIDEPWLKEHLPTYEVKFIKFEDLPENSGITFDQKQQTLTVEIDKTQKHVINLPPNGAGIKGGNARIILHKLFGQPEFLAAELPVSDTDFTVFDTATLADQPLPTDDPFNVSFEVDSSPQKVVSRQDITHNSCFITHEGIWFTKEAELAYQTGIVTATIEPNIDFYGRHFDLIDETILPTQRQLFRTIKLVAEGRASAVLLPESINYNLGKFWLIALERYLNKPDLVEILQNLYLLEKELGVAIGNDFVDSIVDQLQKNPDYKFGVNPIDDVEFYLLTKLINHIHEYFSQDDTEKPAKAKLPKMKKITLEKSGNIDFNYLTGKLELLLKYLNLKA